MIFFISILVFQVFTWKVLTAPTESLANSIVVRDVAFIKLGTYRGFTDDGAEYQKSFFLSRYSKSFWAESQAICSAYGMELVAMETLAEARDFLCMVDNESSLKPLNSTWIWTDGITLTEKSTTDWYWTKTGMKVSFLIDWYPGNPSRSGQFFLGVSKGTSNSKFGFNDIECNVFRQFACQRIEFFLS